jgi:hypothetical protein
VNELKKNGGELSGVLRSVFQAGECLQRGLCDLAPTLLTPGVYTSRGLMRTMLYLARQSAELLAVFAPRDGTGSALREFRSKLQVFDLFENVDIVLGLPARANPSLEELLRLVNGLDRFSAVWATEGIGHYYAETAWESGAASSGLLTRLNERDVPRKSLVALHAGMGLSLANRLLARVGRACRRCSEPCDLSNVLRQFVSLCEDNSDQAYVAASYEGLGLVARNLYPHLIPGIDRELSQIGDNLRDYFWHGVGRAIYFAPTNYVPIPGVATRTVELTQQEPPHELGRRNALAGSIWAMVLVNLRDPNVIENLLIYCGDVEFDRDAFANGVSSAAVIWCDATESTAELEALCMHQPNPAHAEMAERWRTLVRDPCRRAVDRYYTALRRHNCIGEVFRYQSLPRLLQKLDLNNVEVVDYMNPAVYEDRS